MRRTTQVLAGAEHGAQMGARTGGESLGERVPLAMTFEELLGGDTAREESADEIVQAVREMRDAPSPRSLD